MRRVYKDVDMRNVYRHVERLQKELGEIALMFEDGGPTRDPSWDREGFQFCGDLRGLGVEYEQIAAYLESLGQARPSAMTTATRASLLKALQPTEAFRLKFDASPR